MVVRRRRDDNPGPYDPKLTDIIGHVVQITEDNVTLTVNAQEVTIPTSDIVAARHIQARPPSPRT